MEEVRLGLVSVNECFRVFFFKFSFLLVSSVFGFYIDFMNGDFGGYWMVVIWNYFRLNILGNSICVGRRFLLCGICK